MLGLGHVSLCTVRTVRGKQCYLWHCAREAVENKTHRRCMLVHCRLQHFDGHLPSTTSARQTKDVCVREREREKEREKHTHTRAD